MDSFSSLTFIYYNMKYYRQQGNLRGLLPQLELPMLVLQVRQLMEDIKHNGFIFLTTTYRSLRPYF